jgi:hypothetical protein
MTNGYWHIPDKSTIYSGPEAVTISGMHCTYPTILANVGRMAHRQIPQKALKGTNGPGARSPLPAWDVCSMAIVMGCADHISLAPHQQFAQTLKVERPHYLLSSFTKCMIVHEVLMNCSVCAIVSNNGKEWVRCSEIGINGYKIREFLFIFILYSDPCPSLRPLVGGWKN